MKRFLIYFINSSSFFFPHRKDLDKELNSIKRALDKMNEKIEVEGKVRSELYGFLRESLEESARARVLTNSLLLKLVNNPSVALDSQVEPSESEVKPSESQVKLSESQVKPSKPWLATLLLSLAIILFLGTFYVVSMLLFYEFLHLAAWFFSEAPEAVGGVEVPRVLEPTVPREVGAESPSNPYSVKQNHSLWYWTAITGLGCLVSYLLYRVMVRPKDPGTSEGDGDRSRSLEIIQNLPEIPHTIVPRVPQTMGSPSAHRADSCCQTDPIPSSGVSTQKGPPSDLVSPDILNSRFEQLQKEFLEEKSKHNYEEAARYSEMVRYKIKSEQASSFMEEYNLTSVFGGWRNNLEKVLSLRDRFSPESSGARDRRDSGPDSDGMNHSKPGPASTISEGDSGNGDS